jgi:hypothetical protein
MIEGILHYLEQKRRYEENNLMEVCQERGGHNMDHYNGKCEALDEVINWIKEAYKL